MKIREYHPAAQLLILAGMIIAAFILTAIATVALHFTPLDLTSTYTMIGIQGVSQLMMFLLPAVIYNKMCHSFRFNSRRPGILGLIAAIYTMVGLIPVVEWLTAWNNGWHLGAPLQHLEEVLRNYAKISETTISKFLSLKGWGDMLLNLVVIAFIPALCEEVLFRGAIQSTLQRWWGRPHLAIIITAAVFSLVHGDIFAFMPRFFLGIVLGYMFYHSGSLWYNIAAHFFNNGLIVVLYFLYDREVYPFDPSEPLNLNAIYSILFIVCAIICYVCGIYGPNMAAKASPKDTTQPSQPGQ